MRPALLTGTSSEYLGRRALPLLLRERLLVCVLGPDGVGKSAVVSHLCRDQAICLDARSCQAALVAQVSKGRWATRLLNAPELVLDGPVWLDQRPAALEAYASLLSQRLAAGRRTYVVQSDSDGSLNHLIARMPPGSLVVLGLRFPIGRRGRLRFAARICDEMGVSRLLARDTVALEPWGYAQVKAQLVRLAAGGAGEPLSQSVPSSALQAAQLGPER